MLVGFVGFIGSGKNYAGEILADEFNFIPESFARPVKDVVSTMFGWDRLMLEGSTKDSREWREQPDPFWSKKFNRDFSPREALQLMGTEVGRDIFHSEFWIYSLEKRLKPNFNYVITDVRFPNEINFIQNNGGIVIHIQRGELPVWWNIANTANCSRNSKDRKFNADRLSNEFHIHSSEWSWIGNHIDYRIDNNSTLNDLRLNISEIIISEMKQKGLYNETI